MSEMGKTTNGDKPATQAMLKNGLAELKTELKTDIARLDKKIDSVAVGLVKTQDRLQRVEENMATKADIRTVIGHIDGLTKGLASYEYRLAVRKHQFQDHERRISALEDRP